MGLCKDCKHWELIDDHNLQGIYGDCHRFEAGLDIPESPQPAWIWAYIDSVLMTTESFGCEAFED